MSPWIAVAVLMLLVWLLPAAIIAFSARVQGSAKVLWVLVTAFTSWLGFLAFMLAASRQDDKPGANTP